LFTVELGLLQGLDLSDDDSAQGIDELAGLGDLLRESVNVVELSDEVGEGRLGSFSGDDVDDLLSDDLDLLVLSITGLSGLVLLSAGESSDENSQNITIISLGFAVSVDQSLPLSDELAKSVSSHIHSVEVGHAGSSLDIFDRELDLSPIKVITDLENYFTSCLGCRSIQHRRFRQLFPSSSRWRFLIPFRASQ